VHLSIEKAYNVQLSMKAKLIQRKIVPIQGGGKRQEGGEGKNLVLKKERRQEGQTSKARPREDGTNAEAVVIPRERGQKRKKLKQEKRRDQKRKGEAAVRIRRQKRVQKKK